MTWRPELVEICEFDRSSAEGDSDAGIGFDGLSECSTSDSECEGT